MIQVSDRYEFEIEKLITELNVYKLDKLKKIRLTNRGKFATIKQLKEVSYIDSGELNKILQFIKEPKNELQKQLLDLDEGVKVD